MAHFWLIEYSAERVWVHLGGKSGPGSQRMMLSLVSSEKWVLFSETNAIRKNSLFFQYQQYTFRLYNINYLYKHPCSEKTWKSGSEDTFGIPSVRNYNCKKKVTNTCVSSKIMRARGFNKNIDLCEHIRSESCRRNRLLRWGITSRMRFTNSVNQLYKHEDIKNDDKHEQKYLNRPIEVTKPVDRRLLKDLFYARTNITESTKYFSNKQQYLSLLILDFCSSRQWPKVRELSSVTEFSVT